MQRPTTADLVNITDLVRSIRPDWPRHIIESVLQSHAHHVDVGDLAVASVRTAQDPAQRDPRCIGWATRHWRDLETSPVEVENRRAVCSECGRRERDCLNRPGPTDPDDPRSDLHLFTPVRPAGASR